MKKITVIIIILTMNCFIIKPAWSEDQPRTFEAIEYLSGFGQAELSQKKDYRLIPLIVSFDFDLRPLTEKIGFTPESLLQFQLEPFLSIVTNPDSNLETGLSFFLKFGLLPDTFRLQPYVKFGTGLIYITQHTLEQTTQFNFISQAGVGFHYLFNKHQAFSLEYRFRHLSNAGIKHPNGGIDAHLCLFGITHLF